jgi:diacylglycerol kinase family enzyme
MKYAILYNPHSCGEKGLKIAKEIEKLMGDHSYSYIDLTSIDSLGEFIDNLSPDTDVILTGGDGSLNSFVNTVQNPNRNIYFYASGSGNDFARDINFKKRTTPICINEYIRNLPTATIDGKEYKFINCVGSGMDGYCCGEVERLRALNKRRANYLYAAIKALIYAYRPCTAHVIADGKEYTFKNAWLVPIMNGRYFGGGFMSAPDQNRLNPNKTLSLVAMYSRNFFKIVTAFLLLMKGKHVKLKSMITIIEGHEFKIKLDRPATLELDGETIPNISEYTVSSTKKVNV